MWIFFIPSLEICCSEDRGASVEYLDVDGGLRPTVGAPSMAPRLLERPFYIILYSYMAIFNEIARNLPLRFATSWNSTAPSVTVLTWSDCRMIRQVFRIQARFAKAQAWWCFHDFKNRAPGFPQHQETPNSFFFCLSWPFVLQKLAPNRRNQCETRKPTASPKNTTSEHILNLTFSKN